MPKSLITVLLRHDPLFDAILEESIDHWKILASEVRVYTDPQEEAELISELKDDFYVMALSSWRVVGIDKLKPEVSDCVLIESIEHHRLDAVKRQVSLVQSKSNPDQLPKIVEAKIYNTIGINLKKQLLLKSEPTSITENYFKTIGCVLYKLDKDSILEKINNFNELQKLTLIEEVLVNDYTHYERHLHVYNQILESITSPYKILAKGLIYFHQKNFAASQDILESFNNLQKLKPAKDYLYNIYTREYLANSLLFRIAVLYNQQDKIEDYGRKVFYKCPSKKAFEINRRILGSYLNNHKIKYDNVEGYPDKNSIKPQTTFVIYCQPRSGSTLITQELDSHPDISSLGELLSGEEPLYFLDQQAYQFEYIARRELDAARLYTDTVKQAETKVAGMKIHGAQLNIYPDQNLWTDVVSKKPKIIYIRRVDQQKQAVSLGLAFENENFRAHPEFRIYDRLQTLAPYLKAVENFEVEDTKYVQQAKDAGCEVLEVVLEDYLQDRVVYHKKMCQFLGVEYRPLSSQTIKQNIWGVDQLVEKPSE